MTPETTLLATLTPWVEPLSRYAAPLTAWMLTYALHSTLLLAGAWLLGRTLGEHRMAVQEVAWKVALVGGVVTATLQLGLAVEPLAGSFALADAAPVPAAAVVAEDAAPAGPPSGAEFVAGAAISAREVRSTTAAGTPVRAAETAPAPAPAATAAPAAPGGYRLWPLATAAVWLAVAAAGLLALGLAYRRLFRCLADRRMVTEGALPALFGRLLDRAGLHRVGDDRRPGRRGVALTASPRLPVPIAWGVARREVSLPEEVVETLSPYHQESILAHEISHLRRHDPAWLALARVIETVLFFQPLNRLARHRLQEIAELRCDDGAVELTGRPLELARCLTEVAAWRTPTAGMLVPGLVSGRLVPGMTTTEDGGLGRSALTRRVRRLLDGGKRGVEPLPRAALPVAAVLLLAVALAAPGVTGQEPAPEPPPAPQATPAPEAAASPAATPAPPAAPHRLPAPAPGVGAAPEAGAVPAPRAVPGPGALGVPGPAHPAAPALPRAPRLAPRPDPVDGRSARLGAPSHPTGVPLPDTLPAPGSAPSTRIGDSPLPAPLAGLGHAPRVPAPTAPDAGGPALPRSPATVAPRALPRPEGTAPALPRVAPGVAPRAGGLAAGPRPMMHLARLQADAASPRPEAPAADRRRLDREVERLAEASDPMERQLVAERLEAERGGLEAAADAALDRHGERGDDDDAPARRLEERLEILDASYDRVLALLDEEPVRRSALRDRLYAAFVARDRVEAAIRELHTAGGHAQLDVGARRRADEAMARAAREAERVRQEMAEQRERAERDRARLAESHHREMAERRAEEMARLHERRAEEMAGLAERRAEELAEVAERRMEETTRLRERNERAMERRDAEVQRRARETERQRLEETGLRAQAERQAREMERLRAELRQESRTLDGESRRVAEETARIDAASAELRRGQARMRAEKAALRAELRRLSAGTAEGAQHREALAELRRQLADLDEEIGELDEELGDLDEEMDELHEEMSEQQERQQPE